MDEHKKVGRKQRPAPDNFFEVYAGLMEGDINRTQATRLLQCSNAQLNLWMVQHHLNILHTKIDELQAQNEQLAQENKVLKQYLIDNNKEEDE